jgi:Cu-Zn family superoxide dismutase
MSRSLRILTAASGALLIATGIAIAPQLTVDINRISESGVGDKIDSVVVSEGKGGVSFKVAVTGLPKGQRGFHVHEKGDCGAAMKDGKMTAGIAAGEHYDPDGKKSHKGPKGAGHKGDLPGLTANAKGERRRQGPDCLRRHSERVVSSCDGTRWNRVSSISNELKQRTLFSGKERAHGCVYQRYPDDG